MENELRNYADFIKGLLAKAEGHVTELPKEALNWRPVGDDTNSIAAIVTHMCGLSRWWLVQGVDGEDVGRDRDSEFRAVVDEEGWVVFWGQRTNLTTLIEGTEAKVEEALGRCPANSLDDTITMPRQGVRTKRWAIVHVIDELSQHLGHLEFTRQLMEATSVKSD